MTSIFHRTSVTVDEAVAIMLGITNGPILFRPLSDNVSQEEQDEIESITFDIHEYFEEENEALVSDLAEAKFDKQPIQVVDEKREALRKHKDVAALANTYICAIKAELNEGEASELRVDTKLSNSIFIYITIDSLNEWAAKHGFRESILVPVPKVISSNATETECQKKALRVRRRHRDQEEAIVAKIKQLGYTPLELPKNDPGKPGVKAQVRDVLQASNLFGTSKIFDHAWERLRKGKEIIDKKE